MSELDENAIINAVGGNIIDQSSLKSETTQTPDNTDVNTEVQGEVTQDSNTVETPENVDTTQSEVKAETTVDTEPEGVEEVEETANKNYNGFDIYKNLDNEFKESYGMSMIEAEQILAQDYESDDYDERELVQDYYTSKGFSDREISLHMKKYSTLFKPQEELNQMLEDGTLTEDQFDLLESEWLGLLREGRGHLLGVQDKIRGFRDDFSVVQIQNNTNDESQKILLDNANRFSPNYSKETLEIIGKDGQVVDSIDFVTDDATKNMVSEVLKDPSNVYSLWMENGKLNVEKMFRDIYKLKNEKAMSKAVYDQAFAKGQSSIAKDQNNIDFNPHRQSTEAMKNIPEGLANAFAQLNGNR